ncbi:putative dehydrogenase [Thermosporothrix hazakensis]|jgi:predicted dehydrogenase|uniref:Oxidoreductase n=2 Tax=Thermosporothrix TaxID=768650 RepID=A0A455SXH9_9CHLR|nr:Gfo/Idh/MocA family oxidoreductase [Thermosporothrix hazakensis]PZW31928.1 putative dehydrogenase [Thermosporothrix hazakensis]BBH91602.1 oxidoreductase [Thermosporothrix sp. COM3]GCE49747.1 oxidoreductase [Thermosporothrix hazakensis]
MDTLRFGIIGCGVIGPVHADALATIPGTKLVAVCDLNTERAQKLADKHQATPYQDMQTMLSTEKPDVVCICTPSGLHAEHAAAALRSGSHVIVEKPLDITVPHIEMLLQVQQETGRTLSVISQHRFNIATRQVRELIQRGALGRLVLGNATVPWWRTQQYYDSDDWRGTIALDGGVLMNQSIHSIDLLQWLMGPVKRISAYTDTLVRRIEAEDVAVAILRFANGALGTISATTGAYPGVTTRIEVFGDQGSAIIEEQQLTYLRLSDEGKQKAGEYATILSDEEQEGSGGAGQATDIMVARHARQIADVVEAIREGRRPFIDGQEGRHPVEIIQGIYESARTGKEVIFA